MNNFPRLELYYSETLDTTLDTFTSSITTIQLPELNYLLYLFIFHEEENIPHFHLINLEYQINIGIRLDKPCYLYHNPLYISLTNNQKEYIYSWMMEESTMNPSKYKTSNWYQLVQLYMYINSKFEEDWIDNPETEGNYPWNEIFNQPELCEGKYIIPDYRKL